MTSLAELTRDILLSLIAKSGVREWNEPEIRSALTTAAVEMAASIWTYEMTATAVFRQQTGTTKTFKSSAGDGAITLASLANGSYRQSAKIDFGATFAQLFAVKMDAELAATPTAGNAIDLWFNPSSSGTAATDNHGGASGSDAAYTGYSANPAAAVKQLVFIGSLVCTAQATATVQKGVVGMISLPSRYGSIVVLNGSGAAFHSSDTNCQIVFTPEEFTSEAS